MTDHLTPRLDRLGDTLERAAARDLRPRRRRSRRVAIAAVAAVIAVPAVAVAGIELISTDSVERSIPAGTLWLEDTQPTCTVVKQDVEYHCTMLAMPPGEVGDWKGAVYPTVDATKHVNGGCRSHNSAGTEWTCYVGQEAVKQHIIGPDFLGEYAPSPSVG